MRDLRIDIISDTHGLLTEELKSELRGADHIVHAGDICSSTDLAILRSIAPVHAVLGNNDHVGALGFDIDRKAAFTIDGVRFQVCHYRERLNPAAADVCVFGHTHKPVIERASEGGQRLRPRRTTAASRYQDASVQAFEVEEQPGALLINPGSPTLPRSPMGPTIATLWIRDGRVEDPQIVQIPMSEKQAASSWFWF